MERLKVCEALKEGNPYKPKKQNKPNKPNKPDYNI